MIKRIKLPFWYICILLVLILASACNPTSVTPTYNDISYGTESRQWLDIYQAASLSPTPVYIWAHPNGSSANDVPSGIVLDMYDIGVTVISWESILLAETTNDVQTGWADADIMWAWVKTNAIVYNLDPGNVIIGGSSRGSGMSWKLANSSDPSIKGIYMKNALPDSFWEYPSVWDPSSDVNVNSPKLFFAYNRSPGTTDSHDPDNGIIIQDRYNVFGIASNFTLIHSLNSSNNTDPYEFLVEFVLSVID